MKKEQIKGTEGEATKIVKNIAVGVGVGAVPVAATAVGLSLVGFSSGGVVAGSAAAGSFFAACQSVAATGLLF